MTHLTRAEKQEIILKMLLIKNERATIKDALSELEMYEAQKGNILDVRG
jgi:hypothetical protein